MTVSLRQTLDEVQQAPFVVDVLRSGDRLAAAAGAEGGPESVRLLASVIHEDDELTAVAAVHALSQVFADGADGIVCYPPPDHLYGYLYIDRLSKRDRKDALRQMEEGTPRYETVPND